MDEVKTTRAFVFSFPVVLPGDHFFPGKYQKHLNEPKK
jgi:hypothetical protein